MRKRMKKLLIMLLSASMAMTPVPVLADTEQSPDVKTNIAQQGDQQTGEETTGTEEVVSSSGRQVETAPETTVASTDSAATSSEGVPDSAESASGAVQNTNSAATVKPEDMVVGKAYSVTIETKKVSDGSTGGMYAASDGVITKQEDGTYVGRFTSGNTKKRLIALTDDTASAENHTVTWYRSSEASKNSVYTIPVSALDTDIPAVYLREDGTTPSNPWSVNFQSATITEAPADTKPAVLDKSYVEDPVTPAEEITLTVTNKTGMFKVMDGAKLIKTDGNTILDIILGGAGYHELYKGTYEEALANGDGTKEKGNNTWIHGFTTKDNKWEFQIPLTQDELTGNLVPIISVSNSHYINYLKGTSDFSNCLYLRGIRVNEAEKTLWTGDYDITKELKIVTANGNRASASRAGLETVGSPASNNYKETLHLTLASGNYDAAFIGTKEDAEKAADKQLIKAGTDSSFAFVLKENAMGGTPKYDYLEKPLAVAFRDAATGKWTDESFTVSKTDETFQFNVETYDLGINTLLVKKEGTKAVRDASGVTAVLTDEDGKKISLGSDPLHSYEFAAKDLNAAKTYTLKVSRDGYDVVKETVDTGRYSHEVIGLDYEQKVTKDSANVTVIFQRDVLLEALDSVPQDLSFFTKESADQLTAAVAAADKNEQNFDTRQKMADRIQKAIEALQPKDGTYTIAADTDNSMGLKLLDTVVTVKDGKITAKFATTANKVFTKFYQGNAADAKKDKLETKTSADNSKIIDPIKDGGQDLVVTTSKGNESYQFEMPVEALGKDIQMAVYSGGASSKSRRKWTDVTLRFQAADIADAESEKSLKVVNHVKMFKPAESATLRETNSENSERYSSALILPMQSDSYSKVYVGYAKDAKNIPDSQVSSLENNSFTIPVPAEGREGSFNLAFCSKTNRWYDRKCTIDTEAGTVTFDSVDYTVVFDTDGGTEVSSQTVTSGKSAKKPEDPTREDYIFAGWYCGDELYDFSTPVLDNITLTARWQKSVPEAVTVSSQAHIQNTGWDKAKENGDVAGTVGKSLRLEAIKLDLSGNPDLGIEYRSHIQNTGWENTWKKSGEVSGTTGKGLRMEAVQIRLTGEAKDNYDVWYQAHVQNLGWLGWAKNGAVSGTTGKALRLEALRVVVLPKGSGAPGSTANPSSEALVDYRAHVQNTGWTAASYDGETAGTTGKALRMEAVTLQLNAPKYSGSIMYQSHLQNTGWEKSWKADGAVSGTTGEARRLEAIRIKLTGAMAQHYDVYYRVHVQNSGWTGWVKNGETAGTTGRSLRAEALEVKLVEK